MMIKVLNTTLTALLACICMQMNAQDIHFSQFYMAPTILNPAMVGVMDCNVRFSANYRNQWSQAIGDAAYKTYSFAYDQKFTVGRRDYWGIGLNAYRDVAGSADFSTTQVNLAGSYSKYLGGGRKSSNYLVFGAELGGANRSIKYESLRFGTQHDGRGGYDPTLSSQEKLAENSFFYMDVSAGMLFFRTWERNSFYIGGAYHHINRPNVSFLKIDTSANGTRETDRLYSKFTAHLGGEFSIGSNSSTSLNPGLVTFFQGPSWQMNLGTSLRWYIGNQRYDKQSFQIGIWTRLVNNYVPGLNPLDSMPISSIPEEDYKLGMDAVILSTRFQYNQLSIGFSYDINVSKLKENSPGNGSFEFTLMYLICGPERRGVYCPSF